jgi:hypothetical protein
MATGVTLTAAVLAAGLASLGLALTPHRGRHAKTRSGR